MLISLRPREGHRRRAAAARRVVQARAPRPDDDRRAQRRGKTTLLRMLAGQTRVDGGELVFEKGTRVALHDQRPPRERDISLRDYVLCGCREPLELEAELRAPRAAMAQGDAQRSSATPASRRA